MGVRGLHPSVATRAKLSAAKIGNKNSLGYKQSPEHRAKIGLAGLGNKRAWRGGRRRQSQGYVLIFSPNHPFKSQANDVLEHRLVMEAHLGRTLLPTEVVHHINGIPDDNRIENLMRFDSQSDHVSWHHQNNKEEES